MAREDSSQLALPSAEVRRKILQRAGVILDEARDLVARLDQYEATMAPGETPDERRNQLNRSERNRFDGRRTVLGQVKVSKRLPAPGSSLAA
jgi:hypothetical protein